MLYFGQFTSLLGSAITMVAVPYQLYQITQSTFMVGLLSLFILLPLLITALIGGVFADRYPRRKLLIVSECIMTICALVLVFNASLDQPRLYVIYLLALAVSGVNGFHRPAFDGITQQILRVEDYKAGSILATFKYNFCMIVGPAIAGVLINFMGLPFTYAIDVITFALSIMCLVSLHNLPNPLKQDHPSIFVSLKEGLQFALQRQILLGSYIVDFVAMVLAMPMALFPAIAVSLGGAKTLGLLYSAPAVGAMLISFFSGWTRRVKADGKAIIIASALWGAAIIGFSLSSTVWLALIFLAASGAFDCISGIFRMNLWNHIIPQEMRGRLSGIEMISYMSGPKLGDFRAGVSASFLGLTGSLISGGILCVLGVIYCGYKYTELWNYREKRPTS